MEQINLVELEKLKKEWKELSSRYAHLLNSGEKFHATYNSADKYVLKVVKNSLHKPTKDFKIFFDDGFAIPSRDTKMTANHILAEFIKHVGATKVHELNIEATNKQNLLTKDIDTISQYLPLSAGDGWFVITKTPNSTKIAQINEIISLLNIKAHVEYV